MRTESKAKNSLQNHNLVFTQYIPLYYYYTTHIHSV